MSVIFQRVDSTSTFYILYPLVEVLLTLTLAAAAGEEVYRIMVVSVIPSQVGRVVRTPGVRFSAPRRARWISLRCDSVHR